MDRRGSTETDERHSFSSLDYLTVCICPHTQPGRSAWPLRPRWASLCRSDIVRKSGKNCLKVTLAWHVRDVPTDRETETRERSCTTKDALFTRCLCQQPSNNATQPCKNTVEHARDSWHHWSIVMVRFGELWIFMMMLIYWVAIGARTANKLSPPCLKGNALPILKTLSCAPKLRLQVGDANPIVQPPHGGLHLEGPR